MTIEDARHILKQIDASTGQEELLLRLKRDMVLYGLRYAHIRADWQLASLEKRLEMDAPRRLAHNAFIDACNILSRNQAKAGFENGWRTHLGRDRRTIGDFACYLHCILGLEAR